MRASQFYFQLVSSLYTVQKALQTTGYNFAEKSISQHVAAYSASLVLFEVESFVFCVSYADLDLHFPHS